MSLKMYYGYRVKTGMLNQLIEECRSFILDDFYKCFRNYVTLLCTEEELKTLSIRTIIDKALSPDIIEDLFGISINVWLRGNWFRFST